MNTGRLFAFVLLSACGCGGGGSPALKPAAPPTSSALVPEASEPADRSPVAAPPELFFLGRAARPILLADRLGRWTGVPLGPGLRALLGEELDGMAELVVEDAPVEVVAALPNSGRRHDADLVVSLPVSSVAATVSAARRRGQKVEKLGPHIYGGLKLGVADCAVGPARGAAPARLVCGDRRADVERLFPYATRGLPDERLGEGDIELLLRAAPLRRHFEAELAGGRLFAGFLVRQFELDNPRFDRALSDAVYGATDELIAIIEDAESLRLSGKLDEQKQAVDLSIALSLRSDSSWLAGVTKDLAAKSAPPPATFGRLPAAATQASFAVGPRREHFASIEKVGAELLDAFLEHEKVPRRTRERAKELISGYFALVAGGVHAEGPLPTDREQSWRAGPFSSRGWAVGRVEVPADQIDRSLAAVRALLTDRELYKLAKVPPDAKDLPKVSLGPLRLRGAPKGARVFSITLKPSFIERYLDESGDAKSATATKPVQYDLVFVADGTGSAYALSTDTKDAATRLAAFLDGSGERLSGRRELAELFTTPGVAGGFATLAALLEALPPDSLPKSPEQLLATVPGRGVVPALIFSRADREPLLTLSVRFSVPAALLGDLPALLQELPLDRR